MFSKICSRVEQDRLDILRQGGDLASACSEFLRRRTRVNKCVANSAPAYETVRMFVFCHDFVMFLGPN
jgi:hypothetical protein